MQLMEIVFTSRIVKGAKRAYAELKDCKQTQKALKVMFSSYLTWNFVCSGSSYSSELLFLPCSEFF